MDNTIFAIIGDKQIDSVDTDKGLAIQEGKRLKATGFYSKVSIKGFETWEAYNAFETKLAQA